MSVEKLNSRFFFTLVICSGALRPMRCRVDRIRCGPIGAITTGTMISYFDSDYSKAVSTITLVYHWDGNHLVCTGNKRKAVAEMKTNRTKIIDVAECLFI